MLELKNVEVIYDDVILVLKGLSLQVPEGKIVKLGDREEPRKPEWLGL